MNKAESPLTGGIASSPMAEAQREELASANMQARVDYEQYVLVVVIFAWSFAYRR